MKLKRKDVKRILVRGGSEEQVTKTIQNYWKLERRRQQHIFEEAKKIFRKV